MLSLNFFFQPSFSIFIVLALIFIFILLFSSHKFFYHFFFSSFIFSMYRLPADLVSLSLHILY